MKNESELIDEAVKAYQRHCDQNSMIFDAPAKSLCGIGWKYVHLRNANGLLAKYNHKSKKIQVN